MTVSGNLPRPVQNLLLVSQLREEAHSLYLTEIREKADSIQFTLFERAKLNPAKIPDLMQYMRPKLLFTADKKQPYFVYQKQKSDADGIQIIRQLPGKLPGDLLHGEAGRIFRNRPLIPCPRNDRMESIDGEAASELPDTGFEKSRKQR